MKFFHLSDLHIGQSNNDEKTGTVTRWIIGNLAQHQAKVVLITGDVVDSGLKWEYEQAQPHIERMREEGFHVLLVPGNHDYGPFGITESKKSAGHFKTYLAGQIDFPHVEVIHNAAFILLDSMKQELAEIEIWGAEGELGEEQLTALSRILDDLEERENIEHVIVALHHHPFDYKRFHVLRDADRLMEVIHGERGSPSRVSGLLFGHKHLEMRFDSPPLDYESRYGIDLIYAAGSTVERDESGKMTLPVIDLQEMDIRRWKVR